MLTGTRVRAVAQTRQTLGSEVAERLREEIISGRLAPDAVVAEIPTAERLGVSRVPVREATLVLERDGLLVFDERGRCHVRGLDSRDLEEIFDMRLLLECETFRRASRLRTETHLATMGRNIAQLERAKSLGRVSLLDIEFHDLVVDAGDHTRLSRLWEIMRGQVQLFTATLQRHQQLVTASVRESTAAGHRELLEFIRQRDGEGAAACFRVHLNGWLTFIDAIRKEEVARLNVLPSRVGRLR